MSTEPASGEPQATITAYPDGPYLVRGSYRIVDADGRVVEVTRRTIALCRCGRSAQKPMCDGSHRVVRRPASDR